MRHVCGDQAPGDSWQERDVHARHANWVVSVPLCDCATTPATTSALDISAAGVQALPSIS